MSIAAIQKERRAERARNPWVWCAHCGQLFKQEIYLRGRPRIFCPECTYHVRRAALVERRRKYPHLLLKPLTCPDCGGSYHSYTRNRKRCPDCKRELDARRWRRRHAGSFQRRYMRALLVERDGTACGVCGEQIDMAIEYPDPQSASIDHFLPFEKFKVDVPENLRLAHLVCNMRRHTNWVEDVFGA